MKSTILKIILGIYLAGCAVTVLTAQKPKTNNGGSNSPLQVGQLENGLTYYIYKDPSFTNEKIKMGFVVKAGSYHQKPEEIEFAHMIEHIPFVRDSVHPEGKDRFFKYDLSYSDVSARSGDQYTRYYFNYPQSHPEAFEVGLSWFREIALELRFDQEMMDRVRSQVQGESIYSNSRLVQCVAGKGTINMYLYNKTEVPFCDLINHMESYKIEDLRAFYRRWYVPKNMGVFVVGYPTMPVEQIIKKIETSFGGLNQPEKTPKSIDYYGNYLSKRNQYINIDTRGLIQRPEVKLYFRLKPKLNISTKFALRDVLLNEMVINLVKNRLHERNELLNNQDIMSILSLEEKQPPSVIFNIKLKKSTSIKQGLQLPIFEFKKIIENGFTDTEFLDVTKTMEDKYVIREGLSAQFIMDELNEHFWSEAGFLPDYKARQIKSVLIGLSKEKLEKEMQAIFNSQSKFDVVVLSSDSISYNLSEQRVFDWIDEAWSTPIEVWEASLKGSEQIKVKPPKELLSQHQLSQLSSTANYQVNKVPEYGITEMNLLNGIKVVLKSFKPKHGFKDRLQFQMIKPGGASQFKEEDYFTALYSSEIVTASGLGTYSKQELEAYFQQPENGGLQLLPYVNHTEIGFRGWHLPGRLEDLLEYLYLHLTEPRVDSPAVANWKEEKKIKLLIDEQINDLKLQGFTKNYFNGDPIVSQRSIQAIAEKKVLDLYKSLFSDPRGYVIVITGNFDLDTTIKLCNKYLGGLPKYTPKNTLNVKVKDSLNLHNIPEGPLSFDLKSNDPRKSDVRVIYSGGLNYTPKEDASLFLLNRILWKRMHNRLRNEEKNSTVYGASSHYELYDQNEYYKFTIKFNCVPSKTERLLAAVREEVRILREEGPDAKVLKNVINELFLNLMPAFNGNAEYMTIQFIDRYNKERVPMYKLIDYIKNITVEDVKALAYKYLKEENYYQFVASKKNKIENNDL